MNDADVFRSALDPKRIDLQLRLSSRKKVLEHIADWFARHLVSDQLDLAAAQDLLLDAFLAREKLGSTGLENGIAIPHCRVANCTSPKVGLLTLTQGIDYDARDREPVDVFFALVVPEEATQEHLEILASIVALFEQPDFSGYLRQANNGTEVYQQITA